MSQDFSYIKLRHQEYSIQFFFNFTPRSFHVDNNSWKYKDVQYVMSRATAICPLFFLNFALYLPPFILKFAPYLPFIGTRLKARF